MVRELIDCKGERHLYEQLLEYLTEHNYAKSTKTQLERKALELHADRIFDNEAWVDFLKFNRKYRPEVAAATKVVYIRTECCSKPGAIPQTQLDSRIDDRVCCPHCGRWTHYENRYRFYRLCRMASDRRVCRKVFHQRPHGRGFRQIADPRLDR